MDLYNLPSELLLAFCISPYSVVALRLTCTQFYKYIPHVREVFVKAADNMWSSGFWVLRADIGKGSTRIIHSQFRAPTGLTTRAAVEVIAYVVSDKYEWDTNWDNCDYVWHYGGAVSFMDYRCGVHYIADKDNIYYFVARLSAGSEKIADVITGIRTIKPDTLVMFKSPAVYSNATVHTLLVDFDSAMAFAGCEQDCKVFRRR